MGFTMTAAPRLFKYMQRRHADALLAFGTVRVGTLYEYREIERLGSEIGDMLEAMAFCDLGKAELLQVRNSPRPLSHMGQFVWDMVATSPEADFVENFVPSYTAPNQYMYCATSEYSPEVMERFGYDTCVEIVDVARFVNGLSRVLAPFADFRGILYCQYRDRGFTFEEADTIVPEIIKEAGYFHQKEVRALWWPKYPANDPANPYHPTENPYPAIAPLIFPCPDILGCCKII
jgi:hypothetical protein